MTVRYGFAGQVATITLDRPDRLNALTPTMLDAIGAAFDRAVVEKARAVLLTGEGRAFCAGADLRDGSATADDLGAVLEASYHPLVRKLRASPVPIVVAVNGPAIGAGASLALLGDIVLAAEAAYFQFGFAQIGLVPDTGATWLVARAVGRARTMAMFLLGEAVPTAEAEAWGLIHGVLAEDKLLAEARALAERLASGPTVALGLIRRQVDAALDEGFDTVLERERDNQRIAGRTADARAAIAGFATRNAPRFDGA